MAISFSRPDPSSPAAVADANFPTARRGFDQQEVREFLRMVAAELARMQERERYLEHELRRLRQQHPATTELDDETLARLVGEETTRILQAARESAASTKARADEVAERMVREAREEAQQLRADAEAEASRRRKDAEADAEAELEMAKQQGREMVEEARAYRERALAELSRRRDLAREQIDQLIHGRDRLVQAFERARLVAVDVVAELAPLGELSEYVNLSPTTGPVPVMVPADRLGGATFSSIGDDALRLTADQPEDPPLDPHHPADGTDAGTAGTEDTGVEPAGEGTGATDETAGDEAATVADAESEPEPAPEPEAERTPLAGATVLRFPDRRAHDEQAHAERSSAEEPSAEEPSAEESSAEEPVAEEPAKEVATDDIDDDEVTANDVDHLFARLRAQREGMITSTTTTADEVAETNGEETSPFERREETLIPLIVASARKLKRILADEQNDVLDRLRQKDPVSSIDELVPAADEHTARYFDAITTELLAAAEAGAASLAAGDEPVELDVGDSGVLAAVRESVGGGLVGPLRDRLDQHISEGSGDNEGITKNVRALYREWKTRHIDDQLDDLLRLAYGRGAFSALEEGDPCRWVIDPAVGPCSDCEDNSLQGVVPAGSPYPTGHVAAPAHGGCRCLVARADR